MKFIDNWQYWMLRLNSIQWSGVWATIVTVWLLTPKEDQDKMLSLLPGDLVDNAPALVVLAAFIGNIIFRLRAQPGLHPPLPPRDFSDE